MIHIAERDSQVGARRKVTDEFGTLVRNWTPLAGPQLGLLITHAESISIADQLTVGDPGQPLYRPTVHYAHHPCDDPWQFKNFRVV